MFLKILTNKTLNLHIVDLVTFLRNKYVTVEGVKIGSRIWKKVKWDLLNKPRMYIQYFVDLRKKCIFVHFYGVFTCILVFYVQILTVLSLFQQYGAGSRSKKHKFQTKLDIENFRSILFWSENVDSGVKLDTSNLSNSQSNQNDLTHLIVLLTQFPKTPKSVLLKGPNDCYLLSRVW